MSLSPSIFKPVFKNPETGKSWSHPPRPRQYAAIIVQLSTLGQRREALALVPETWTTSRGETHTREQVMEMMKYFWEQLQWKKP